MMYVKHFVTCKALCTCVGDCSHYGPYYLTVGDGVSVGSGLGAYLGRAAPGAFKSSSQDSGPGHRHTLSLAWALKSHGVGGLCSQAPLEGQKWPHQLTPNLATPDSALERHVPGGRSTKSQSGHLVTSPDSVGPGSRSWAGSPCAHPNLRQAGRAPGLGRPGFSPPSPLSLRRLLHSAPWRAQDDLLPVGPQVGGESGAAGTDRHRLSRMGRGSDGEVSTWQHDFRM